MDGNYQTYINRVVQMTLPNNYKHQLKNIQSSPKFLEGKALDFPGYSVINPPNKEEKVNEKFYNYLQDIQQQLIQQLPDGFLIPLPPETFHLTLADLIWEKAYINAVKENPNFDELLISAIEKIFTESKELTSDIECLELEVLGMSVFPRAIAVCLSPTEKSYHPIVKLRESIYQNEEIIKLGIEQHYDFVAHITLGYFGNVEENINNLDEIESTLKTINDSWLENSHPIFQIKRWELRKFTNMINYIREPHWANIQLGS